jgi:hypothetical protein
MNRKLIGLGICFAALAVSAAAQSGTVLLDSGNSNITELNGNVGIGTTAPSAALDLHGGFMRALTNPGQYTLSQIDGASSPIGDSGIGSIFGGDFLLRSFWGVAVDINNGGLGDGGPQYTRIPGTSSFTINSRSNSTTFQTLFTVRNSGNVGIATQNPRGSFDVYGSNPSLYLGSPANTGISQLIMDHTSGNTNQLKVAIISDAVGLYGRGNLRFAVNTVNDLTNVSLSDTKMYIDGGTGNVGIGTTNPGDTLEVNGTAKIDGALTIGGNGIVFPDGTSQGTAFSSTLCGGDYAESVDVTGERTKYEPGDVLVIDPKKPSQFLKSFEQYSTSVAGIYSTKPGTVGRRQTAPKNPDEVPMAMIGIVPAKVSAENGAIGPGDLLVTASTPGYAMKGSDRGRLIGAVLGKSMGSLDSGTGVIEVLVTLQ